MEKSIPDTWRVWHKHSLKSCPFSDFPEDQAHTPSGYVLRCILGQKQAGPGAAIWTLKAHYSREGWVNLVTDDSLPQPDCLRLEHT